jgi:hAT family C-terminal dimerisation region
MLQDYADDPDLLAYLESAKALLHTHYATCYADSMPQNVDNYADTTGTVSGALDGSPSKVSFTSRYKKKERQKHNELEEYFKLPQEDFDSCKPLQWWVGRQAQFPTLYCLVQDLLTIPGKFYFTSLYLHGLHAPYQGLLLQWSGSSLGGMIQSLYDVQVSNQIQFAH